jgi:hypothetical protein
MPFTLSHAAAALPLARRSLVPSAVVAGTLVPDLMLFARLGPTYDATHSAAGVVTWAVLLAIVALAIWYGVLREPLLALAPGLVSGRVPPRRRWHARDLLWVPVSAALGAGTHVLWDSFTHRRAQAFWGRGWLGGHLVGGLTVYGALQYLASAAGLAVLVVWGATRPLLPAATVRPVALPERGAVLALVLAAGLVFSVTYAWDAASSGSGAVVYEALVGAVTGGALVLGGYATVWRVESALRQWSGPG